MRLSKLLLVTLGATVLLCAFASSASAGRFSNSETRIEATWARMSFRGALATVECEVILDRRLHSRVITKTAGSLIGYITAANVNRCSRGTATILRETLPWHLQYDSFVGTLPNITAIRTRVIGASVRMVEPVFAIDCLLRSSAAEPMFLADNRRLDGSLESVSVSGTIRCGRSINGIVEGTSVFVTADTVTLI